MESTIIKNLSLSFINSFALRCAVDLDISGRILAHGGPMPLNELARSIPIPPERDSMLGRLMALLVHQGIFAQSEAGYLLTPASELIPTAASNMGAFVRAFTEVEFIRGWDRINELLTDTGPSTTLLQKMFEGKQLFEVLQETPKFGNLFNEAMAGQSTVSIREFVAIYPHIFDGLHSLVDVGGGTGYTLKIIADTFPKLRCTLFDRPHVVAKALKSDSFHVVGGDMFERIPPADAIFMKNIIHDWSDEDSIRILKRCKEAIESSKKDGGKVIVVDMIVDLESDDPKVGETILLTDISMMCYLASKERKMQEWHDIIMKAGYSGYKICPTRLGVDSVIELYP